MPDTLKQISNATYGIGALTDGIAIASTNATTQNVIKDIQVQNNQLSPVGAPIDFVVNGVTVAPLSGSVTGSEIIDVSSTAIARATATFTNDITGFFGPTSGSAKATTISEREVNGFATASATVATQSAALTVALTAATSIAGQWFVGSDFFYLYSDNNSQQILYRRVGGINGTENTVFSDSYATVVFNGVDRFHQVQASNIRTYVPSTNTTTSVAIQTGSGWPSNLNSYPRIAYANGFVFWYNSLSTSVYAINPTTGYVARITAGAIVVSGGNYAALDVYYSGGNYYILSTTDSTTIGYIYVRSTPDFGPLTSTNPIVSVTTVYDASAVSINAGIPINTLWPKLNRSTGDWLWFKSVAGNVFTFGCFNLRSGAFKADVLINTNLYPPAISGSSSFVLSSLATTDDSANKLNTAFYPQTVTLRVTGVQTTP